MAKRLLVASTDLMMVQFLLPHIVNLCENGFEVEIACSDVGGRMEEIREELGGYIKAFHTLRLVRSPASFTNIKGYRDAKKLIKNGKYDCIWTNEPVMGVVTRIAARKARKNGTKVLYMVHGFHFYRGAPWINWLLFYPIEKFAGYFCDCVVTVNREDFQRAKQMKLPAVKYIHGIGINPERLDKSKDHTNIRAELHLPDDTFLLLSVGELNENKNHTTVFEALAKINDPGIHYLLCGKGDRLEKLQRYADKLGIADHVHFLGYRMDVLDICCQVDVYVMSSHREGLPVSSLEAMYCGLPLITSDIRGLRDIMQGEETGFLCDPDDVSAFAERIQVLKRDHALRARMSDANREVARPYCIENTEKEIISIIHELV